MKREMVALIAGAITMLAAAVSPLIAHHSQAQYTGADWWRYAGFVLLNVTMATGPSVSNLTVVMDALLSRLGELSFLPRSVHELRSPEDA